jgi:hypothetical protein
MSPVPAGSYPVGTNAPNDEAAPARSVQLSAFAIDTFEVTNADYNRFVQTVAAPAPIGWSQARMPADKADHPVKGVEWVWAQAYCTALTKRLPREAEWEAAARGPAGLAFPWGPQPGDIDLDTPGSRPVGAVPGNISPFGVHDTVGSAWEWVDEPYEPVPDGQKVRRGGEYGRVRNGAAMRQHVDPNNESTIAETGFRCAADRVDPGVAPGQFSDEHVLPPPTKAPSATSVTTGQPGVLLDEQFDNTTSGWPVNTDALAKVGYHAPSWYHVEPAGPGVQVVVVGGFDYADAVVETAAYVDKTATPTGRFRYGIVFRAYGARRSPMTAPGPLRPENFYAFVVDPRGGEWELLHEDVFPLRVLDHGSLPQGFLGFDASKPDVLRVEMRGTQIKMFVNGADAATLDTRGYHPTGDLGFYVEALDEPKPHVHFDRLTIKSP